MQDLEALERRIEDVSCGDKVLLADYFHTKAQQAESLDEFSEWIDTFISEEMQKAREAQRRYKELCGLLSTNQEGLPARVQDLFSQRDALRERVSTLREKLDADHEE